MGSYGIKDFEFTVELLTSDVYTVDFEFIDPGSEVCSASNFTFTYFDSGLPYVKYVTRAIDESDTEGTSMAITGVANITRHSRRLLYLC